MVRVTTLASVCPNCGTVFQRYYKTAYCDNCKPKDESWRYRNKTTDERGYNSAWQRLSKRARKLQPFCTDCGSPDDLTGEHTEQAWQRFDAGKSIRLQDIDVLCVGCNSSRGAARGEHIGQRRKIVDRERLDRVDFLTDD